MKNDSLKSANRLSILRLLYRQNMSRIDLVTRLGLSKSAVSCLVDELMKDGLIKEIGRGNSSEAGGKKPIILSINPYAGLILSIHMGDRSCNVAISDLLGRILGCRKLDIVLQDEPTATFDEVLEHMERLLQEYASYVDQYPILACGISAKGLVDPIYGIIKYSSAQPNWSNVPVGSYFADRLGVRVFVENDARAAACLEMLNAKNAEADMIGCVCIESGIGTSIIMGNQIISGSFFGAVNFAHTILDPQGPLCRCGKRGCWEALASTEALAEKVRAESPSHRNATFEEILSLYKLGDECASRCVLDYFCYWVGVGVSNILTVFNPRKLVVYGNATLFDKNARDRILEVIHQNTNKVSAKTQVVFGDEAETLHIRSAAAVALKQFLSAEHHRLFIKEREWD